MEKYPKIQTVFLRDPANRHKTLLDGEYAKPEFEYLKSCDWIFTEKIDGTNIRVGYDKWMLFGGKTDNAQVPTFLLSKLQELFPVDKFCEVFDEPELVTLYGEGYGAKIQKGGGNYISNGCSFILFDVNIRGIWLERSNVEDIASKLGINVVPFIGTGDLLKAVDVVSLGFKSIIAQQEINGEGIVMRPKVELKNRRGERIISKVKYKDFAR
jgi:hypothetical protein